MARARQRAALEVLDDRLRDVYGSPRRRRCLPPLDEAVLTILSQNTSDTNRDRAWERLRARFPDWEAVASAPIERVEEALRPGGLHRVKARRIRETLARVHALHGRYDLDHLQDLPTDAARSELSAVKGLGAKSVNCILLFSLRRPAFPVDTHVYRVLRRLGVHRTRDLTRANLELADAVPDGAAFRLHMNLIRHGREVCHARRPECWRCPIHDLCAWRQKGAPPGVAEAR